MGEILEYTDKQTGVRLTVEYDDISENPTITVFPPEENVPELEVFNKAVRRLMNRAGLLNREIQLEYEE